MFTTLAAAFTVGLATSVHCVGMCGGLILAVGGAFGTKPSDKSAGIRWAPNIAYHLGRVITYTSLGVAFGAGGALIKSRIMGVALFYRFGMIFTVALLVIVMLHFLGITPVGGSEKSGSRFAEWLGRLLRGVSGVQGAFVLGILTGFLPCMPLYAALGMSIAAGSPFVGGAVMAVFWAGTVPLLLALGQSGHFMMKRLQGNVVVALAIIMLTVAISLTAVKMISFNASRDQAHKTAPLADPHRPAHPH